jgi:D-alanyl-D-alanine carboxypeptidase/D-alanyl-D-alanine-endopeptidase (penicillin-binding protein 4)
LFALVLPPCSAADKAAGRAVSSTGSPYSSSYDLQRRIDVILGKSSLRKVLFSVRIVDAKTGEAVYEKNAHLALIPASNMKIVTSAAALEYLGRDFAFVTRAGL